MTEFGAHSEVGSPAQGHRPSAGPGDAPADADQRGRAALRRCHLGPQGAAAPRWLRGPHARRVRRHRLPRPRAAQGRRGRSRRARLCPRPQAHRRRGRRARLPELRAWMDEMDSPAAGQPSHRRRHRRASCPTTSATGSSRPTPATDFVMAPLPNQLFTRDSSAWIYGGVTINPMFWPARRKEVAAPRGDLQVPPRVPRRRLPRSGGAIPMTATTAAPRSRAATSCPWARASCSSAWASAPPTRPSARLPRRSSRRAPPSGSSRPRCRPTAPACTSTRSSRSAIATWSPSTSRRSQPSSPSAIGPARRGPGCHRREDGLGGDGRARALGLEELRVIPTGGDAFVAGARAVG